MNKKDTYRTVILRCPKVGLLSQVVEDALEDALSSALSYGDEILEGTYLGVYQRCLEDQFFEIDGDVTFNGSEEEHISYRRDPYSTFLGYCDELTKALETFALENRTVIDLVQRHHSNGDMLLLKKLPNHWIIAVKGG